MALGDVDAILDSFLNRNIGTSGLASRQIQQSNIENNQSLRSAVQQSQQTLNNQKKSLDSKFINEFISKNKPSGVLHSGTRGGVDEFDPTQPAAFINFYGDNEHKAVSMGGVRDPNGRAIRLTFAGGGNLEEGKDFAGLNDLFDFINNPRFKGTQFRLAGTPSLIDPNELRQLEERGITPISVGAARDVVKSWPKMGFNIEGLARYANAFNGGRSGRSGKQEIEVPNLPDEGFNPSSSARPKSVQEILTSLGRGYRK